MQSVCPFCILPPTQCALMLVGCVREPTEPHRRTMKFRLVSIAEVQLTAGDVPVETVEIVTLDRETLAEYLTECFFGASPDVVEANLRQRAVECDADSGS